MTIFEPFDVVAAPFPYVERPIKRRRPCLIIATPAEGKLAWVLMITSEANQRWKGDVRISNLTTAGLKSPSLIRTAKIATVEVENLKRIGSLAPFDMEDTIKELRHLLPSNIR